MMADYAFWAAVAFMAGCNLYFGPRIRGKPHGDAVGVNGQPTWYAPKALGLWGMVAFALAVRLLIWAASTYIPESVHGAEIGLVLFSAIVAVTHLVTLVAAVRAN